VSLSAARRRGIGLEQFREGGDADFAFRYVSEQFRKRGISHKKRNAHCPINHKVLLIFVQFQPAGGKLLNSRLVVVRLEIVAGLRGCLAQGFQLRTWQPGFAKNQVQVFASAVPYPQCECCATD